MKKPGSMLKHLALIGCITAISILLAPAVSAEVFIPAPYSVGAGGTASGSPVVPVVPSLPPVSTGTGMSDYPAGIVYPLNPALSIPSITGQDAGTQIPGTYYAGSVLRPAGFSSSGAKFMCSF